MFFFMVITSCFSLMVVATMFFLFSGTKLINASLPAEYKNSEGNIGIVEINGMILSSKEIIKDIKTFKDDTAIKAIILRIDSPGGGIGPSQEIYREINKIKTNKKIIASMGSVAASGGYYIACATDGIIANPGTITGSIGVIMEYANFMEIAKKIGIAPVVIKSGEFKDMGSPMRNLEESEKKILQELVNDLHLQFVTDVANSRKMDIQTISSLADGRVYTGKKAVELKLIDRIGNLDDAVQWAGELSQIEGELKPVYPREDKLTFFKKLADSLFKNVDISGTITDNFRYIIN